MMETHTEETLLKVFRVLKNADLPEQVCLNLINEMLNEGILFRERSGETNQ